MTRKSKGNAYPIPHSNCSIHKHEAALIIVRLPLALLALSDVLKDFYSAPDNREQHCGPSDNYLEWKIMPHLTFSLLL
jgi:hypothetical protein